MKEPEAPPTSKDESPVVFNLRQIAASDIARWDIRNHIAAAADEIELLERERDSAREALRVSEQRVREHWQERDRLLAAIGEHVTVRSDQYQQIERLKAALKDIASHLDESYRLGCLERMLGDKARAALSGEPNSAPEMPTTATSNSQCSHALELASGNKIAFNGVECPYCKIERLTRRVVELQQFHDWAEPQMHDHGRDVLTIERLTRERDEAREAYTDENLHKHGLIGKYGRLRAALAELLACKALREKIDGELSACHQEMSPQLQALENEYQLRKPLAWRDARAALSGEPTSARETTPAPASKKRLYAFELFDSESGAELRGTPIAVYEATTVEQLARELETRTIQFDSECRHSQLMRDANKRLRALLRDAARQIRSDSGPCPVDMTSRVGLLLTRIDLQLKDSSDETSGDCRPIETVPDPQITPVLGAVPRDASDFAVGEMHQTDAGWYWAGNDPSDSWGGQIYPAYWQPLPEPPSSAVKASGEPTSGSGCPACGVMYVAGARHFSGCPLHPGEAV